MLHIQYVNDCMHSHEKKPYVWVRIGIDYKKNYFSLKLIVYFNCTALKNLINNATLANNLILQPKHGLTCI